MSAVEAILFDLDDTLISTSKLEDFRRTHDVDGVEQNLGKAKVFDHVFAMLMALKEKNIPMGIVTNSPRWYTVILLEHFSLDFFDVIVCYDDVGAGGIKPSAKGINIALEQLKLTCKSNVLYIGDQDTDFIAAYIAGIKPIAPSWATKNPITQIPAAVINSETLVKCADAYEEIALIADRTASQRSFDFHKMQMNFIPLNDKGELVPLKKEQIRIISFGRYFSQNSPLTASLHENHQLSKEIFSKEVKPAYTVPQYYISLVARALETLPQYLEKDFDIVTVIPSKKEKTPRLENLLNRVETLAATKARYITDLFEFAPHASSLKTLGGKESRLQELQQKMTIKTKYVDDVIGKSILVIDDVITTGATFEHAFRLLESNGASFTFGLCLAKTVSVKEDIKLCPMCGRVMRIRTQKASGIHFYGCSGYFESSDKCTYIEDLKIKDCPQCDDGYLVKKFNSAKKSYFLGCSSFKSTPQCKYTENVDEI